MAPKIKFTVEDKHFDFLSIQRGDIADLAGNRAEWEHAYVDGLYRRFENIRPHLPPKVVNMLDVGSGLGGINAIINQEYGGNCHVHLIDGVADKPRVVTHSQTFNDMSIAKDFLKKNGVKNFGFTSPADTVKKRGWIKYDLIFSFASYCFHYAPKVYLDYILHHSHKDTVFIFDVRKDKLSWQEDLNEALKPMGIIWEGKKAVRMVYGRK